MATRSSKLYSDSPEMKRDDESGKMSVKKRGPAPKPKHDMSDTRGRHAREHAEMNKRHLDEHKALNEKQENEAQQEAAAQAPPPDAGAPPPGAAPAPAAGAPPAQ